MRGGGWGPAVALLLAACGPALPPGGDPVLLESAPEPAAVPVRLAPISLTGIRRGALVGRAVFGLDCAPPYDRILWTQSRFGDGTSLLRVVNDALTESGMTLAGPDSPVAAPLTLTGRVSGLFLELCRRKSWLTGSPLGESGVAEVTVAWTLAGPHGPLHQTVTRGRAEVGATPEGDAVLLENAVADAAGMLAADAGFRRALARTAAALPPPLDRAPRLETPDRTADAADAVVPVGNGRGVVVGRLNGRPVLVAAGTGAQAEVAVGIGGSRVPGVVERTAPALGLMLVRLADDRPLPAPALSTRPRPPVSTPLSAAGTGGGRVPGLLAEWRGQDGGLRLMADLGGHRRDAVPGTPLLDGSGAVLAVVTGPPDGVGLVPAVPVRRALAALGVRLDGPPDDGGSETGPPKTLDPVPPPPT